MVGVYTFGMNWLKTLLSSVLITCCSAFANGPHPHAEILGALVYKDLSVKFEEEARTGCYEFYKG